MEIFRNIKLFTRIVSKTYKNLNYHIETRKLSIQEEQKTPKRFDIINFILSTKNKSCSYLEIGVRNPDDCFNKVKADIKFSVDPGLEFEKNPVDFKMTSDDFFKLLKQDKLTISKDTKFDVIFIDGLHLAEQVYRDIEHSLQFIKNDGFIVLHDCNPPTSWHAREEFHYRSTPASGFWNGTTWKAFVCFRKNNKINSCTIDTDWGVGIISKEKTLAPTPTTENQFFDYYILDKNRKDLLGLISFEEFKHILLS